MPSKTDTTSPSSLPDPETDADVAAAVLVARWEESGAANIILTSLAHDAMDHGWHVDAGMLEPDMVMQLCIRQTEAAIVNTLRDLGQTDSEIGERGVAVVRQQRLSEVAMDALNGELRQIESDTIAETTSSKVLWLCKFALNFRERAVALTERIAAMEVWLSEQSTKAGLASEQWASGTESLGLAVGREQAFDQALNYLCNGPKLDKWAVGTRVLVRERDDATGVLPGDLGRIVGHGGALLLVKTERTGVTIDVRRVDADNDALFIIPPDPKARKYNEPSVALCPDCCDRIGGATGEPDFRWHAAGVDEPCGAVDPEESEDDRAYRAYFTKRSEGAESAPLEGIVAPGIAKRPDVCGGSARIAGTRIAVWVLAMLVHQGNDIETAYPQLTSRQITAAMDYYNSHRAEVDREIAANMEDD